MKKHEKTWKNMKEHLILKGIAFTKHSAEELIWIDLADFMLRPNLSSLAGTKMLQTGPS
jgi:hypothetical protein